MQIDNWVIGDSSGLAIPSHPQALLEGGTAFLTRALHHEGVLAPDNHITDIHHVSECGGGSTGRKLFLTVDYALPSPHLHRHLFVKFSRDFDDPIRDRLKDQLAAEVRLGLLSHHPAFPIAVPACYFADYQLASGTGILITQQVEFGENGLEPLYEKCLDYLLPNALEHYQTIFRSLATLAGTQQAGLLDERLQQLFPYQVDTQSLHQPIRYTTDKLLSRLQRYAEFAHRHPQLMPDHLRSPEFIQQLAIDIPRFLQYEASIKAFLLDDSPMIALMHWNANLDNAWFWRDTTNQLNCGLMDWGSVGQMNMGLALWGSLSAAELDIWDDHLQDLLQLFTLQLRASGGSKINVDDLRQHLLLSVAMMGLAWLMDAPALIQAEIPNLEQVQSRFSQEFEHNETARTQLHMFTNFLNLWRRYRFGEMLDDWLQHQPDV